MEALRHGDPPQVGGFRLIGRLGAGGMGQVYLGVSPGGRQAAIKVILPALAADARFRSRFRREVAAARKIGGVHTAALLDADPEADPPWMATAFIPGPALDSVLRDAGPLDEAAVRDLGLGLAEGLAAIHAVGLVHRDLKPGNVIMAADGPRIIDFGLVRFLDVSTPSDRTASGALLGTIPYMSPEQVRGERAGPESDVFSLGGVLTFAATGHAPFDAELVPAIMHNIVTRAPDIGPVNGELRAVIAACLTKAPGNRPRADEVLRRLSRLSMAAGIPEPVGLPVPVVAEPRRGITTRAGVAIFGLMIVAVTLLGVLLRAGSSGNAQSFNPPAPTFPALPTFGFSLPSVPVQVGLPSGIFSGDDCLYDPVVPTSEVIVDAGLPSFSVDRSLHYRAVLRTNLGSITMTMNTTDTPCEVNSFVYLAEKGYFNRTQCYGVTGSGGTYAVQCGDPTATASSTLSCKSSTLGNGGPGYEFDGFYTSGIGNVGIPPAAIPSFVFASLAAPTLVSFDAGAVALIGDAAGNYGSRFLMTFQASRLPLATDRFATITSGLGILRGVAGAGATCLFPPSARFPVGGGPPVRKLIIESVQIAQN